jgi:S-adenosylmethionine:tRNA ribosyltransferase-isomerase
MSPATWPRQDERLLVIDGQIEDARVRDLRRFLREGDLLVVNDAATLPASLMGNGYELRLAGQLASGAWTAVLFGAGDWRTRTEDRPAPPRVAVGQQLVFGELTATVTHVSTVSPRLLTVRFEGDHFWERLYRAGKPVQYAHVRAPLDLWHVQNAYAARPWAVEMPSAGRPLGASLLKDVEVATLTHAAGLSSTGDAAIDALLPFPERYEVPLSTLEAARKARRVIAVGTTVVRALESAARGQLAGVTDLRIGPGFERLLVDGLITGLHESGSSHMQLLSAFAPEEILARAYAHAERAGYLAHEFGDVSLIISSSSAARRSRS